MKYIGIFDTSVMSFNIGDQIIMESARRGLRSITKDAFVVNMPTHSPLFHWWEFSIRHNDSLFQNLSKINYKFVCGTNLLEKNLKKRKNIWNIHKLDSHYINDFILVGVGTDSMERVANKYTSDLYQAILSHQYIHSTRDEKTKKFLEAMGFKAVNTGCPTLWSLTDDHCNKIPKEKRNTVVFTVTDYMKDPTKDKNMINILLQNYEDIYCWIQGSQDIDYLKQIGVYREEKRIKYIPPSLQAYNDFLENVDCDYIGTRLHAGIKAMQKKRRTIIIGVDNRAYDIHCTYNLNYLDRKNINQLSDMLYSDFTTRISIDQEKIDSFLKQFLQDE